MADSENHSQVVTDLLSSIRTCVNAFAVSTDSVVTPATVVTQDYDDLFDEATRVESAILLLLEERSFSVHNIRVDVSRNEYRLSPVLMSLNDNPDGTGGGVRYDTIPYRFARLNNRKKWQVVYMHDEERSIWSDSHDVLDEFWREIDNPQSAIEEKKPLFQSVLSTLYTQDCLDNPEVKEFIIAIPQDKNIGLLDALKAECAEGLPRQIEHREHVFSLLTECCRYAKIPSKPSVLYSLLRSVEGVPSEEQLLVFFDSRGHCTVGHLNQGAFIESTVKDKALMVFDPHDVYAVGVVDEGRIKYPIVENGYYNFNSNEEASYLAKTLAIIQEGTLETFRIAELVERLRTLREKRDYLRNTSDNSSGFISRLRALHAIPVQDIFPDMI